MFKLKKPVSIFARIKNAPNDLMENVGGKFAKLEKKVEGTMAENWLKYWKTVCKDYRDVAVDVGKQMKEKPSKAILLGSTFGLLTYCAKHNPTQTQFRDAFIKSANEVSLVHHMLLREDSTEHLKLIEACYNREVIRHTSLGIVSFMWIDNYSIQCNKFDSQCSYLRLKYMEMVNRIVDVGFLDTWWVLAKKMTDYDINY